MPAREADELVTKQFLRAELAELRTDMQRHHNRLLIELGTLVAIATAFVSLKG